MLSVSVVAGGVYLWPQMVVLTAGSNGVYALFTTTAVAMAVTSMQIAWTARTQHRPYTGALQDTWGKWGLWILFPIGALTIVGLDATMLSLFGDMMRTFFYPMTPRVVTMAIIVLAGVWIAVRPLNTVARIVQFWFPLVLLSALFLMSLSLTNLRFARALIPSTTLVVPQWARASLATWFLYANGATTASLVPHVRWKKPGGAIWVGVGAIGLQGSMLLMLYAITLGTLGPPAVARLQWPIIYVFSLVTVRTFFLKGVGIFVIITWTTAMVLYLAVHFFALGWNLESLATASARHRWWITALVAGAVWFLANLVPSDVYARWILFRLFNPLDLAWTALIVPLSLGRAIIRSRRKGGAASCSES